MSLPFLLHRKDTRVAAGCHSFSVFQEHEQDRVRLNTISSAYAESWLRAVPNQILAYPCFNMTSLFCITIWLGIPLFPDSPDSLRCVSGSIIDPHGDHLLGCGYDSALKRRHNALCDIIWHAY